MPRSTKNSAREKRDDNPLLFDPDALPDAALLTIRDVAAWFRLHRTTVERLCREANGLPCVKLRRERRVTAGDARAYLAARRERA